ncbi:MAG: 16S rRNA (adenine(1518)-N(6)/adenine(1519)-N(6))-dimethyltransferase RsmA [Minisyncoccia bacterium]
MYFKAKKSLGQNFLKSEKALKAMVLAAEVESNDIVLEIGPGQGALTEHLLKTGATVVAVEKDDNLFIFLQEKFAPEINNKKLFLIHGDILEFGEEKKEKKKKRSLDCHASLAMTEGKGKKNDREGEGEKIFKEKLIKNKYKIAANIPYYITGQIIRQFLTSDNQPSEMAILVQKEVAERIVTKDGKESLLSIGVKAYGHPKKEMIVSRGSFSPAPNVDSAIISIKNISRDYFSKNKIDEEKFWEIIHYAFAHKRKTLSNNLRGVIDQKTWQKFLQKENLPPSVRAEDLTLKNWVTLFI